MMLLLPIGLLLMVLTAVGLTAGPGRQVGHARSLQLLDTRLARGEISSEEHQQRRQVLTDVPTRRAPRGGWWVLGGLGVALLVAGPLTTGASTGAGSGWWSGHPMDMAQHMGWKRTAAAPTDPPVSGAPEQVVEAGDLWFAPDRVEIEAGTYEFTCTVPGHAAGGMSGELVVTASP